MAAGCGRGEIMSYKLWLSAVLLGSLALGGTALANSRKDKEAAEAADKAEKASDKAAVANAKAVEKANKADRSRRRHGIPSRTRVIEEERTVEQPAPPPAPAPDVNVQINN
jgi:hypothetical protein